MVRSQKKNTKGFADIFNKQLDISFDAESLLSGKKLYVFAFFVPVIILFISYMIFGVYPAGRKSVLAFDLSGQYVYYYENLRDAFWGNRSFFNSWSRNLSGETIGLFSYYMASPFMLVVMLMPHSMITESIMIMQLLKAGTAAVAFCWYLRRSKGAENQTAFVFSILYSLMAYTIVQLMNPMWLDGLIYLPLICFGIEQLIDRGRLLRFIVPLALMFMANFYIGWMLAIFSCLYFLTYYFFLSDSEPSLGLKQIFICGVKFAFCGILSAVCAAWLLMPTYYSLTLGKFDFASPDENIITNFALIDFFMNLLPNTYDTVHFGGSPVVYCGILTIILVPLYFFNGNIPLRKKIGYGLLSALIIFSMYLYKIDIIWHGFSAPNGIPFRYSFVLSFLLLIIAAHTFERIGEISLTKLGCVFFLILGYVMYLEKLDPVVTDFYGDEYEKAGLFSVILFTIVMLSVYVLLLYFHQKYYRIKPVPVVIALFTAVELVTSSVYTMHKIDDDVMYSDRDPYTRYITLGKNTVSRIYDMDDGVYRIEKNFRRTVNDAMAFGSFGLSHSSSTLNSAPIELIERLGFSVNDHTTLYSGATYVTDAVFGIKYLMEKEIIGNQPETNVETGTETVRTDTDRLRDYISISLGGDVDEYDSGFRHYDNMVLTNQDSEEIMYVYENPYALPIAFMADASVAGMSFESGGNPFENQNMLLSSLISDEKQEFFSKIDIDEVVLNNVKHSEYDGHDKYEADSQEGLSDFGFKFTVPSDDPVYMYLLSDHGKPIILWFDNYFLGRYYIITNDDAKNNIITLGEFEAGTEHSLDVNFLNGDNETFFKEVCIYSLDMDKFEAAIETLKRQPLEIESFREDHIKGTVTAEKDGILFTTISWEPGWTVYVDGVKTEPVKLVDALIGIPMAEGTHTIEMKFFPRGMALGIVISLCGMAVLVIIGLYERKKTGS